MRRLLLVLATSILLAPPVLAQQPTYTLKLTQQELLYLGDLLDKEPLKAAVGVYNSIQNQVTQQQNAMVSSQRDAFEKSVRDKVEAEAKAKADAEKPKPPDPAPPTEGHSP